MQQRFDRISQRKHQLFRSQLQNRMRDFSQAFNDLLNCDQHLNSLDSDENRAKVDTLNDKIWAQASVMIDEHIEEASSVMLRNVVKESEELTNEE